MTNDAKSTPRHYPAYTVDDNNVIREYLDDEAWVFCRSDNEVRVFEKDLPKDFKPDFSFDFFDV